MTVEFESVVTVSAAKQIAESLRAAIMDGRLKVDERLPTEEELAQRFKVSRPTVREALKRLAAQHLIRSRRGPTGGNFVSSPAPEEAARSIEHLDFGVAVCGTVACVRQMIHVTEDVTARARGITARSLR